MSTEPSRPWVWHAAGDSLTRYSEFEYPYQMRDPRFQVEVVAEPGARLSDLVETQLPRIVAGGATLVTLTIGSNDILSPIMARLGPPVSAPEEFRVTLHWVVRFLKSSATNRKIVLGTVPDPTMYPATRSWRTEEKAIARGISKRFNEAIHAIGAAEGSVVWKFPTVSDFGPDGFHPTRKAHGRILATLAPLLPKGPAPLSNPSPLVDLLTVFPTSGPPGTVLHVRGPDMFAVKRVVYRAGDAWRMCPVIDRSAHRLTCEIPRDVSETSDLWAIRTPRPSTSPPNALLVRFRVAPPERVIVHNHAGVWLGYLPGNLPVRLDLDQAGTRLSGRAWIAARGRAWYGPINGRLVDGKAHLSGSGPGLPAVLDLRAAAFHVR